MSRDPDDPLWSNIENETAEEKGRLFLPRVKAIEAERSAKAKAEQEKGAPATSHAAGAPIPQPTRARCGDVVTERELDRLRALIPNTDNARNATLNDVCFALYQRTGGGPWEQDAISIITSKGVPHAQAIKTMDSARNGAAAKPRAAHRMPGNVPPRGIEALPSIDEHQETPESPYIDWDDLWAEDGKIEWLLEPVIPAGRLVALYSPPGIGKSLLAQEMASAIAAGTSCLGAPTQPASVLYLDYENVRIDVRDRLQDMGRTPNQLTNLHYWSFPQAPALDTLEGGQTVLRHALNTNARLVVIDTVSRSVQGEENDNHTWLALYRNTLMPLKAAGIATLRLDHPGKDETKGQRGGSAKLGDVDLVWRMEEIVKEQTYLLKCEKNRIQMDETMLNIRRAAEPVRHEVDTRTVGQAKTEAVLAALDAAGLPLSAGRDVARRAITAAGIRIGDRPLSAILKRRQGILEDTPGQD